MDNIIKDLYIIKLQTYVEEECLYGTNSQGYVIAMLDVFGGIYSLFNGAYGRKIK